MPRPKTKSELITASRNNFDKLHNHIESIYPLDQLRTFHEGTLNRNISDVLAHLHEWHLMMLNWYQIGMQGDKPKMPAEGYSWKDLPQLNKKIWEKYKDQSLAESKKLVQGSFEQLQQIIDSHSNEELFEKKRYGWTGSTSLAAYLISATASHYDWALKLIKKGLK